MTSPKPKLTRKELVLRYLAAFGPAVSTTRWKSGADYQAWRVRKHWASSLVSSEVEYGRVLYDLPEAPRPDQVAAPVRLACSLRHAYSRL